MCFRDLQQALRKLAFPLCAWVSAAVYLVIASGYPIPAPGGNGKDLSRPFPCMNCQCGCRSADECWHSCCCFTLVQRIAWAKENHVQPPEYALVQARAQGIDVDDCCSQSSGCCQHRASHSCCDCQPSKSQAASQTYRLSLIKALQCSGVGLNVLSIGVAVIPPVIDCNFLLQPHGLVPLAVADYSFQPPPPRVPPPRNWVA
jgi:hypothetical protein